MYKTAEEAYVAGYNEVMEKVGGLAQFMQPAQRFFQAGLNTGAKGFDKVVGAGAKALEPTVERTLGALGKFHPGDALLGRGPLIGENLYVRRPKDIAAGSSTVLNRIRQYVRGLQQRHFDANVSRYNPATGYGARPVDFR